MTPLLLMLALAAPPARAANPCNGSTTPQVNACLAMQLDRSEKRLAAYLAKAHERFSDDGDAAVNLGIDASQRAFEAYRAIECATLYEQWKGGTIRGAMSEGCMIELTDQRTHMVWANWLRYADSTPPLLPEPKPMSR